MTPFLTVYMLDCGNAEKSDPERSLSGFDLLGEGSFETVCIHGCLDFSKIQIPTDWGIFIYSDEWMSPKLAQALPQFLEHGKDFDVLSLYKIRADEHPLKHLFQCPRIYRKHVRLRPLSLEPEIGYVKKHTLILDGFLYGE